MENLSAAKQVCNLIGLTDDEFYNSILTFKGATNRLQLKEIKLGRSVIIDFAHSPSKLKASIDAVKLILVESWLVYMNCTLLAVFIKNFKYIIRVLWISVTIQLFLLIDQTQS